MPASFGRAGAGRDDDVRGLQAAISSRRDLVVADDLHRQGRVDLPEPLHEVVGERVVVVDQEDHGWSSFGVPVVKFGSPPQRVQPLALLLRSARGCKRADASRRANAL